MHRLRLVLFDVYRYVVSGATDAALDYSSDLLRHVKEGWTKTTKYSENQAARTIAIGLYSRLAHLISPRC